MNLAVIEDAELTPQMIGSFLDIGFDKKNY
jgi:hypothetical protein